MPDITIEFESVPILVYLVRNGVCVDQSADISRRRTAVSPASAQSDQG